MRVESFKTDDYFTTYRVKVINMISTHELNFNVKVIGFFLGGGSTNLFNAIYD